MQMAKMAYLLMAIAVALLSLPAGAISAQKPAPNVPITYPGDTAQSISRRAQWVEAAKTEGKLALWGTPRPQYLKILTDEFNKIYPSITVDYWSSPALQTAAKWEAEFPSRSSTVDLILGGSVELPRWRKMGMLSNIIDIIPWIGKFDKRMYSKNGDWIMPGHSSLAPMYNTKLVPAAEAPKNWDDLLDPKWKGQIGITMDMKPWHGLALGGGWGIEKTEDFLRRLSRQELRFLAGPTEGISMLIAGEFKITGPLYIYNVPVQQAKGAPLEWVRVNPVVVTGAPLVLSTKAPHPNASKLFVEWLLSPQGLAAFEKGTNYGCAFPGSNTLQSRMVGGLGIALLDEEVTEKGNEMGLDQRFGTALGLQK